MSATDYDRALAAVLESVLNYDADSGALTWKVKSGSKGRGTRAGSLSERGYRVIGIGGKVYKEHQIIWLMMTGSRVPQVDHINMVKDDNRWVNLRVATTSNNKANNRGYVRSYPLPKGVYHVSRRKGLVAPSKPFTAQIRVRGKCIFLGTHATPNDASRAYQAAAQKYFGEFSNHA